MQELSAAVCLGGQRNVHKAESLTQIIIIIIVILKPLYRFRHDMLLQNICLEDAESCKPYLDIQYTSICYVCNVYGMIIMYLFYNHNIVSRAVCFAMQRHFYGTHMYVLT